MMPESLDNFKRKIPWSLPLLLYISMIFLHPGDAAPCPAGFQCTHVFNGTSARITQLQCPEGTYSLQGWNRCCSLSASVECGVRFPGHFALNSSCQCNRVACAFPSRQDLMRDAPGRFVCDSRPRACRENPSCASESMVRERHTCNCLGLSYPCLYNEVLWGDRGGPFECLPLSVSLKKEE